MIEFLIETLIIVLISCILGIVAGLAFTYFLMKGYGIELIIDLKTLVFTLLLSVLCGSVFGVYPAYKASKLNPVESLKG